MEWPKSGALTRPNAGEDVEQKKVSFTAGGNAKMHGHSGRLTISYKTKHFLIIGCSNYTSWYLPKGFENLYMYKNLHTDVYRILTHNCQNLEATKMPFSR